jgi:hypothetical protein
MVSRVSVRVVRVSGEYPKPMYILFSCCQYPPRRHEDGDELLARSTDTKTVLSGQAAIR